MRQGVVGAGRRGGEGRLSVVSSLDGMSVTGARIYVGVVAGSVVASVGGYVVVVFVCGI